MLYSAISFLCVALISGVIGIACNEGAALEIARSVFVLCSALFLACVILGIERPTRRHAFFRGGRISRA